MFCQFDSEDEWKAAEANVNFRELQLQSTKQVMNNTAKLPRTPGLRTPSEVTTEITHAGLDPSWIQKRMEILAKVAGAKRKRHREDGDAEIDIDGGGGMAKAVKLRNLGQREQNMHARVAESDRAISLSSRSPRLSR